MFFCIIILFTNNPFVTLTDNTILQKMYTHLLRIHLFDQDIFMHIHMFCLLIILLSHLQIRVSHQFWAFYKLLPIPKYDVIYVAAILTYYSGVSVVLHVGDHLIFPDIES